VNHAVLSATAPWQPLLVGVEVLARHDRRAARVRVGMRLPADAAHISVSDLLLYAPRDSTPRQLADALPLALATTSVSRAHPVGLYWETYGLPLAGADVGVSLTVTRTDEGWMHRAAAAMHLAVRDVPLDVHWREVPDAADGIASRAVSLDLSHLAAGRYRIVLTVTPPDAPPTSTAREITLR
jgi:hypothetical protein